MHSQSHPMVPSDRPFALGPTCATVAPCRSPPPTAASRRHAADVPVAGLPQVSGKSLPPVA